MYRFTNAAFEAGSETRKIDDVPVRVYSAEKTLCRRPLLSPGSCRPPNAFWIDPPILGSFAKDSVFVERTLSDRSPLLLQPLLKENAIALSTIPFSEQLQCMYIVEPGKGHGFGGPDVDKQVLDFFDKHLKEN